MSVNLDRIVQVDITRATRTISRRSWGTVLIAAYHTVWPDRVREYEDPADMLTDGFGAKHPAYLAAVALCSQSPRPRAFKIGRRLGTPDQTVRLTPATPVADEVFGITIGGVRFEVTADATPSVSEICAALTLLINADADAIIASGVNSAATAQNLSGASLNGVIGDDAIAPARNLTITVDAHADWNAKFKLLRQHGMSVPDTVRHGSNQVIFETHPVLGYNYRMTDIQAAVGREQLRRLPGIVARRREIAETYKTLLASAQWLGLPQEPSYARSNWQSFAVRLPDYVDQKAVMQAMLDAGIATRRGIMCAHREDGYKANAPSLPHSEACQDRTIILPLYPQMTNADLELVVKTLKEATAPK